MFGGFRIAKAKQASVTALQSLLVRPQIAEPWPPQFWQDPFVIGFLVSTVTMVAEMAVRPKKLTSNEMGAVVVGTFKELGGHVADLGTRIERLGREKNEDYWLGVKNAEKVTVYMYGGNRSLDGVAFDEDSDVKLATDLARDTAVMLGTADGATGRDAIGGSLMYLLFHVPAEKRLGMDVASLNKTNRVPDTDVCGEGGGHMTYSVEEQDKTARKLLMSLLPMHPENPRSAYAMMRGQPPSDVEWAQYGKAWERNWDECVELYQTVMKAEEVLKSSYQEYLANRATG